MAALSAYSVYTALKDLANKDQRGFINPDTFNSLAPTAQMMVFNDMLDSIRRKRRMRQGQVDGGFHLSSLKRMKEDLSSFAVDLPVTFGVGGVEDKPDDFAYSISAEKTDGTPIDILYDENKLNFIRRSTLAAPTEDSPLLVMSNSLQIFPSTVSDIVLRYYKYPEGVDSDGLRTSTLPTYAYTTINNIDTYDPVNSVDFELPNYYMPYLILEMGRMIGLNLRDVDILKYSQMAKKDNDVAVNVNE